MNTKKPRTANPSEKYDKTRGVEYGTNTIIKHLSHNGTHINGISCLHQTKNIEHRQYQFIGGIL